MLRLLKNRLRLKSTLIGLIIAGAMVASGGCTISIEGLGDLGDSLVAILDGSCDFCDVDVVEIVYDD